MPLWPLPKNIAARSLVDRCRRSRQRIVKAGRRSQVNRRGEASSLPIRASCRWAQSFTSMRRSNRVTASTPCSTLDRQSKDESWTSSNRTADRRNGSAVVRSCCTCWIWATANAGNAAADNSHTHASCTPRASCCDAAVNNHSTRTASPDCYLTCHSPVNGGTLVPPCFASPSPAI